MIFITSSSVAGVKKCIFVLLGGRGSDTGRQVSGDAVASSSSRLLLMPHSYSGDRAYDCRQLKVPRQATIDHAM